MGSNQYLFVLKKLIQDFSLSEILSVLTSFSKFSFNKYRENINSKNDNCQFFISKKGLKSEPFNPLYNLFLSSIILWDY